MRPRGGSVNRGHSSSSPALAAVLLALSTLSCATGPELPGDVVLHPQEGMASEYAARMAGRRTASGDTYRPGALTAAHRSLPFGTRVRVSRINATGSIIAGPVTVRINDRGPFDRALIIDLSQAAARALDMRDEVARVRLEVIELPGRSRDPPPGEAPATPAGPPDPEVVSNGARAE